MVNVMPHLLDQVTDQHIVYPGTWEQFKLIQKGFEDSHQVRLSYYEGMIEILMPGQDHENFAWMIGYFLMTVFTETGIFFKPTGAMTQEKEGLVSAQADVSFCIGSVKLIPDLAIEVVFTSGGITKLPRHKALGVSEVWFWEDGTLKLYSLREGQYEPVDRSQLAELENLDLELLKRCILMAETDPGEAIRAFRQGL